MSIKRRMISVFTAAGMLLTAIPMSAVPPLITVASAESENVTVKENVTLEEDMTVNGNLTISDGTFKLNGHKLTVGGNIYHSGGKLDIGTGTVKVGGNYELQAYGGYAGTGEFELYKPEGVLDVDGNVVINSAVSISSYQYDGKLIIGGSLTVRNPSNGRGYMPSESHVTEFKGDENHKVTFYDTANYMNKVAASGKGQLYLTGETSGFTLDSDITLMGGSEIKGSRKMDLNGHTLTVDGNFTQNGDLVIDVEDSAMNVSGNYYQPAGALDISNGTVKVGGNYELQAYGGYAGKGSLDLYKPEGVLDVDGNVVINSTVSISSYQYDGKLVIGGSLTVRNPDGGRGYMPSGSHVTEFKGDEKHTVTFYDSSNCMNKVAASGKGQLYLTGETSGFTLDSDMTLTDGSEIKGNRKMNLNGHTLNVDGNFTQNGDLVIDVEDSAMNVSGNYYQPAGALDISNGTVKVGGNYELQAYGGYAGTGSLDLYKPEGVLDVDGNVVINSTVSISSYQYDGKLVIGGSLTVRNPDGGRGYMPSGGHITEFKGDENHKVTFYGSSNYMNKVAASGKGQLYLTGEISGFTLVSDITLTGGSEINGNRKMDLNGNILTVDGNFTQKGDLVIDVEDSIMQISGNYYQPAGALDISNGTVKVGGNYELQAYGGYAGTGSLELYKPEGVLDVDGDVVINSTVSLSSYQYDGKLVIGGSLTVRNPSNGRGYMTSGGHVTEFKGGNAHKVYFADTKNYTNHIKLGIGDSIEFTGALNGIVKDSKSELTADSDIAVIDRLSAKGVKEGVCNLIFSNSETSVKKRLEVSETNKETYKPVESNSEKQYSLALDDNAMILFGVENGRIFSRSSLGGLLISSQTSEEAGGITFSGCNELTYAQVNSSIKKLTDISFKNCYSLMKLVILDPECDLSGLTLSGFNGTVYGYTGSTAEAYAKEHGLKFSSTGSGIDDGKEYSGKITISLGGDVTAHQGDTVYLPIYMDTNGQPMYGSNICVKPDNGYIVEEEYLDPKDCGFESGLTLREDGGYDVDPEKPVRVYKMVISASAEPGVYTAGINPIWADGTEPEVLSRSGSADGDLPLFFKTELKKCSIKVEKAAVTTTVTTAGNTAETTVTTAVSEGTGTGTGTGIGTGTGTNLTAVPGSNTVTSSDAPDITTIAPGSGTTVSSTVPGGSTTVSTFVQSYAYKDIIYIKKDSNGDGEEDSVTITLYDVAVGTDEVDIPADIEGIPVKEIGEKAFEKSPVKSVSIPESVEIIGDRAFAGSSIESVKISDGVKTIGEKAFENCGFIKSIEIPKSVESIGESAFVSCGILESVTIRNPDCKIIGDSPLVSNTDGNYSGAVYVPKDSPLQEYAEKNNYKYDLIGDVNRNKQIDIYDAIHIARYVIKAREFNEDDKKIADFNDDGKVNIYDAIKIARYILEHKNKG